MDAELEKKLREFLDERARKKAERLGAMYMLGWVFGPIGFAAILLLIIRVLIMSLVYR